MIGMNKRGNKNLPGDEGQFRHGISPQKRQAVFPNRGDKIEKERDSPIKTLLDQIRQR